MTKSTIDQDQLSPALQHVVPKYAADRPSVEERHNGLDMTLIVPKRGAKYSPNLYRWLKHREHREWTSRVYRDSEGTLWIGMYEPYADKSAFGELIGARLMRVLCSGSKVDAAAWVRVDAVEVVGFWDQYVADGRCAIDREHKTSFAEDESRWSAQGDSRSCLWCGKANQVLKRWTETVSKEAWI